MAIWALSRAVGGEAVAPACWKPSVGSRGAFRRGRLSLPLRETVADDIGPEGGLTAEEMALARRHGAYPVTLGSAFPRPRPETAGLVAAALVLGALGELG